MFTHTKCSHRPHTSQQTHLCFRPVGSLQSTASQRMRSFAGGLPTLSRTSIAYLRMATACSWRSQLSGMPLMSATAFCRQDKTTYFHVQMQIGHAVHHSSRIRFFVVLKIEENASFNVSWQWDFQKNIIQKVSYFTKQLAVINA